MLRFTPRRRGRKALAAVAIAVGLGTTLGLAGPAGALSVIGPTPTPANATTITYSTPVEGLVAGQGVGFTVNTTSPNTLNKVHAKICATGYSTYSSTTFGYSGSSGTRCVYGAGVTSGSLSSIQAGYQLGPIPYSSVTTSGAQSFAVGTGTVSWTNANGNSGGPLTCDSTHNCDLVVDVGLTGDSAATDTWFIQPLTFAGNPSAPTIATVVAGNGQATVNYNLLTSGAASGNALVSKYTVHAEPKTYSAGACAASGDTHDVDVTTGYAAGSSAVTGTSALVTGLTNFCEYNFTVKAQNTASDASTHFTGSFSGASAGTPASGGPATVNAAPGDSSVNLTWSAVGGSVIDYKVSVTPNPATGPCSSGSCLIGGTGTTYNVTGLTNGTPYTFTVRAKLTGGFFSNPSSSVSATPNGAIITQSFSIDKPGSQLVLSQYCSGSPTNVAGYFDPTNNSGMSGPVPNTNCAITMSGPRTNKVQANAITADPRSVTDAAIASTTTLTSDDAVFVANDLNQKVSGDCIPANTRIATVVSASQVTLSNATTCTLAGGLFVISGQTVNFGAVSGLGITADTSAYASGSHVGHGVEGPKIAGGSTITAVPANSYVDVSQPVNGASNATTTREWLSGATNPQIVSSGPDAGKYFKATGVLNQVFVSDDRAADTGWTITGQASSFTDGSSHSFGGNNLGWKPRIATQSTSFGGYSMAVTAGSKVSIGDASGLGSGSTTSTDSLQSGSVAGKTLAYANSGAGLGIARVDADLTLAIPLNLPGATYTGTLTLTAI